MNLVDLETRSAPMGTVSAELLKLRRRPAWWILIAVLLAAVVLFGYLLSYVFTVGGTDAPGVDVDEVLRGLLPANVLPMSLSLLGGFGGPIALILAALFVGSEYSWGTTKTIATQRPGRLELAAGKLVALAVALAVFVVATLLLATASSLVVASLENESTALPSAGEMLRGAGQRG